MKLSRLAKTRMSLSLVLAGALASQVPVNAEPAASAAPTLVTLQPAPRSARIAHALLLDVARAGNRIVAVGEGGTVALSDDDGKTFRRAHSVPVQAALTSVHFVDDRNGWAVGHWGVILHTTDGGETWSLQAEDLAHDRPLYSVWFKDAQTGVAVGLWSKVLRTTDGGKSWNPVQLEPPEAGAKADRNLFHLFADGEGRLYATAEAGWVLRSDDAGATWHYMKTGYAGSLWTGIALRNGTLLVGGLRGTMLRSSDHGATWSQIEQPIHRSITSFAQSADGEILASGLDGLLLKSKDGEKFVGLRLPARLALTAVLPRKNASPLLLTKNGVVIAP
jgi:photosystem II stability/assembly factor-like uncharacterized protein